MDSELLLAYIVLLSSASGLVYFGSLVALKKLKADKSLPPIKDDSSDEEEEEVESITAEDAYAFPLYGSAFLFSLYLIFKYLSKDYIKYIFGAYLSVSTVLAATKLFSLISKYVVPKNLIPTPFNLSLTQGSKSVYKLKFNYIHMGLFVISTFLSGFYLWTKNWIVSNLFGVAFSLSALQLIQLDSFKTGFILLGGLFFYDVFWVFGSDVMVTVATKIEAPAKLLWPRSFTPDIVGGPLKFTLLGLGDIVVPGVVVSLCLQFDRYNAIQAAKAKGPGSAKLVQQLQRRPLSTSFPKPYFTACMTAYVSGLLTTFCVMHTFKAAQPALLYLSPACSAAPFLVALYKGKVAELMAYEALPKSDDKKVIKDGGKDSGDEQTKKLARSTPPGSTSRRKKI